MPRLRKLEELVCRSLSEQIARIHDDRGRIGGPLAQADVVRRTAFSMAAEVVLEDHVGEINRGLRVNGNNSERQKTEAGKVG